MNYAKIKKKYPKAYTSLDRLYKDRDLYDFFDSQGIIMTLKQRWMTNNEFAKEGDVRYSYVINLREDEKSYNRTEAEEAGFEKCFEILERELQ